MSSLASEEIEALAAKGVDLSAQAGNGGLTAIHRAVLTGSTDALRAVRSVCKAWSFPHFSEDKLRFVKEIVVWDMFRSTAAVMVPK